MEEQQEFENITPEVADQPEADTQSEESEPELTFDEYEDNVLMALDPEPDPDDLVHESDYAPEDVEDDDEEYEEAEGDVEEPESEYDEYDDEYDDDDGELSEELESAVETLLRDGWTIDDLEQLSEERLISVAEHRRRVQSDVDRKLRNREPDAATDETDTDFEASPAEPNSNTPDYVADLKEQAVQLADALGLDQEGADLLINMQTKSVGPLQQLVQQQADALQAIQQQLLFQEIERMRSSMVTKYPMVQDPESERWQAVLDRMGTILENEEGVDPRSAMEDAILLEFRDDLAGQARTDRQRVRNLRDSGQPTVRSRPEATPTYSTSEEREDAVLNILESNDPDKYARARAIGRANF